MEVKTGYFAKVKKYRADGYTTVSIARSARYYAGEKYIALAPPYEMIHLPDAEYVPKYRSQVLGELTQADVINDLQKIGEKVILLCHEKPSDFCHRQLVAEWLKDGGFDCEEWSEHCEVEKTQEALFE